MRVVETEAQVTGEADLTWQLSLFDVAEEVGFDRTFSAVRRIDLDGSSWLDHAPRWVRGSDRLFAELVERTDWGQRTRRMYDKSVTEPRLTSSWHADSGVVLAPPVLEEMRSALSDRYGVAFDSVGSNLYRDGRDSVAWHRDRISQDVTDPIVVLVSLGEPRRFLYRPFGGGSSKSLMLGAGTLLVTGGKFQREWEHSVPKVASAGPRMSIAFRHGMSRRSYEEADEAQGSEG